MLAALSVAQPSLARALTAVLCRPGHIGYDDTRRGGGGGGGGAMANTQMTQLRPGPARPARCSVASDSIIFGYQPTVTPALAMPL